MDDRSDLRFVMQWAMYLKKRQITDLATVLAHRPKNVQQLGFVLEIVVQIEMLRGMGGEGDVTVHPIHLLLGSCLQQRSINDMFNQGLVERLLSNYEEASVPNGKNVSNGTILPLIVDILTEISRYRATPTQNYAFQQLKMVGKWAFIFRQKTLWPEVQLQLKRWPSLRILAGCEWRDQFMDLVLAWLVERVGRETERTMQAFAQFQAQQTLLGQWMSTNSVILLANIATTHFICANYDQMVQQARTIAKVCGFKACKHRRQVLKRLKDIVLSLFAQNPMRPQSYSVFAILFTQLEIICKESGEDFSHIMTLEDLITHEGLFYATLWDLEEKDLLHRFNSFTAFMRNNSAKSVLQINRKIVSQMTTSCKRPQSIELALQERDRALLFEFNYCPVAVSKAVLSFYLSKSGINLPVHARQRLSSKRRLRPTLRPVILDPLHFLLIKSHFWEDLFDRDILELSLWVVLDSYLKWLQQARPKDVSDKQFGEYCKKVNLVVTIFLLGLSYPTKLLQYYPIESDLIKDIIVQPVFPALVLANKFFFSSYDRNEGRLQKRMEAGLESWALPWSHLLANPKSMVHYIHADRGYELALAFIAHYRTSFDRIFGDFFVFRITAQLQSLGIGVNGVQKEGSQKLSGMDAQRRKCMVALLHHSERCGEKIAVSARRLLEILQ